MNIDKRAFLAGVRPYRAPFWLKGGHLQTVWTQLLQLGDPGYRREYVIDSTGTTHVAYDFVDGDPDLPLVVIFHGLEGSSSSHYSKALAWEIKRRNLNGVIVHYRSCGNVPSMAPVFYHSGDTVEVQHIVSKLKEKYSRIYGVDISMGGNLLAKYLGDYKEESLFDMAVLISAPFDIKLATWRLNHLTFKHFYTYFFLKTLIPKALAACEDEELKAKIRNCKTMDEFDQLFTAPIHGFKSAYDYYESTSAKPVLKDVTTPTLIINAKNDPIVPINVLPPQSELSESIVVLQPDEGGHVGFIEGEFGNKFTWLPETTFDFFDLSERFGQFMPRKMDEKRNSQEDENILKAGVGKVTGAVKSILGSLKNDGLGI